MTSSYCQSALPLYWWLKLVFASSRSNVWKHLGHSIRRDGTGAKQLTRGAFDVEPVYSPDGRWIAFGRITHDAQIPDVAIYAMHTDGTHLRQVVPSTFGLEHPDSPPKHHTQR